jgi:o-succinylbenzoate---CoA ligase
MAPLILSADPNWTTVQQLLAAWNRSQPVFLVSPQLPEATVQSWSCQLASSSRKDLALFLLTSGSSGTQKLAAFTERQLWESAETVCHALGAQSGDRWLLSLPLDHVGGLGVVLRALWSGGSLIFVDRTLSPAKRLLSAQARFASLVPTQLYRLLRDPLVRSLSTHLLIGGAPCSQSLYQKALRQGLSLSLTYALTEMSSTVLLTSAPIWNDDPLPYLGFPLPNREFQIAEDGELLLRGSPLFEGYGINPEKPDWFATGDLAAVHPLHGIKVCGRKDSQFLYGGESIQPAEIEIALLSLPEVEQAVVVPLFDEEFGARPVAYVQTTLSAQALTAALVHLLPKSKIPIAFLPLDASSSFKPNRKKLTEVINNQSIITKFV